MAYCAAYCKEQMMRSARLHKLSELEIKNAPYQEKDYTINDGGNLYLNVRQYGAKEWLFRYTSPVTGKEGTQALGVTLTFPAQMHVK